MSIFYLFFGLVVFGLQCVLCLLYVVYALCVLHLHGILRMVACSLHSLTHRCIRNPPSPYTY